MWKRVLCTYARIKLRSPIHTIAQHVCTLVYLSMRGLLYYLCTNRQKAREESDLSLLYRIRQLRKSSGESNITICKKPALPDKPIVLVSEENMVRMKTGIGKIYNNNTYIPTLYGLFCVSLSRPSFKNISLFANYDISKCFVLSCENGDMFHIRAMSLTLPEDSNLCLG